MKIIGELNCIGLCLSLSDFAPYIGLLIVVSIALLAAKQMRARPKNRLFTFVSAQVVALLAILATFYIMQCSEMLTVYLYSSYVVISTILIFGVLRFYDRILVRRLDAKPVDGIMDWVQEFVDALTSASVYYYDSAVPKAFAAGRSIFVSVGLLEALDDDELKAVLAHEAWHIRNNSRTPFLKQLSGYG
ncbi:MAG: M48 family metalloprotease [Candidatus Methanoperedens sp.]|nr:M48 family metalloprotease [Candidatus Methanoperedens sp.]